MLEKKIACFHQINKPKFSLPIFTGNGIGNCNECSYDPEKNKKCKNYIPALAFYVHSKEEKNEEKIIKYEGAREY